MGSFVMVLYVRVVSSRGLLMVYAICASRFAMYSSFFWVGLSLGALESFLHARLVIREDIFVVLSLRCSTCLDSVWAVHDILPTEYESMSTMLCVWME